MSSGFFVGKLRQLPTTFMNSMASNSDVSNDILASQQYQQPATESMVGHQLNSLSTNQ